jgi:hypothetical protein
VFADVDPVKVRSPAGFDFVWVVIVLLPWVLLYFVTEKGVRMQLLIPILVALVVGSLAGLGLAGATGPRV